MMQPSGVVPQPMAPMSMDQQQHPQVPPQQQYPPQQQWLMMPPPQQQQPQAPPQVWGQQPMAAPQQPQPQQYGIGPTSTAASSVSEEIRSLWIGDLQYWMDENYLSTCFFQTGEVHGEIIVYRNLTFLIMEFQGFKLVVVGEFWGRHRRRALIIYFFLGFMLISRLNFIDGRFC